MCIDLAVVNLINIAQQAKNVYLCILLPIQLRQIEVFKKVFIANQMIIKLLTSYSSCGFRDYEQIILVVRCVSVVGNIIQADFSVKCIFVGC